MMQAYEIVYILDAGLERAAVDAKLDTFHAALDGDVWTVDHWGLRQLAYPIGKRTTAYYVVVHVDIDPMSLPEFERLLRLDEETVRYLIVVNEGQPTSGASILASPRPNAVAAAHASDGGDGEPSEGSSAEAADSEAGATGAEEAQPAARDNAADAEEAPADAPGPEGAEADGAAEPGAEAGDADADEDEEATPRSGPPEFAGARGRRRRHEGPPIILLNYKDVTTLSRFLTEQGRILPKRTTKVTARFQRRLGAAIKRARYLALIPYMKDHGA